MATLADFLKRLAGGTVLSGPGTPIADPGPTGVLPPPGSYDPNLDYLLGASQRGLGDLADSTKTAQDRALAHYLLSQQGIINDRDLSLADLQAQTRERLASSTSGLSSSLAELLRQAANDREDIPREAGRQLEDIGRQRGDVARNYDRLALGETGAIRQSGVGDAALLQAAAARAGNQAHDVAPLDVASARVAADRDRNLGRLNTAVQQGQSNIQAAIQSIGQAATSSYSAAEDRIKREADQNLAELGLGYNESGEDLASALAIAQREQPYYAAQLAGQMGAQAGANGFDPASAIAKGGTATLPVSSGFPAPQALVGGWMIDPKTGRYVLRRP